MEKKKKKKLMLDHYEVLGLPTGKQGAKLTEKQITKAYRTKALQLHPDKRPNYPNANAEFQKLKSSYELLINPEARKRFDASLVSRITNKPSDIHHIHREFHKAQREGHYRKTDAPKPKGESPSEPNSDTDDKEAADNQQSKGDDHEDIEDWVMV